MKEERFDSSLIPVPNEDGSVALDYKEFLRPGATKEGLGDLKTVFSLWKDIPVDENGTTSGQHLDQRCRAAAHLQEIAEENGLKPRAHRHGRQ